MPKNTLLAVLVLIALIGIGAYFLFSRDVSRTSPKESPITHEHAGFAIFTNGLKRDFSASKYHNQAPAAHIHASDPEIIHIHEARVTWGNFFNSLPVKVEKTCLTTGTGQKFCNTGSLTLKFYINGEKVNNILPIIIKNSDQLLVSFGVEDIDEIKSQLSQVANPKNIPLDPKE